MRYAPFVAMLALAAALLAAPATPAEEPVWGPHQPWGEQDNPGPDPGKGPISIRDARFPWLRGGGDGGSPWPTLIGDEGDQSPSSARLGDVHVFTYAAWNGRDLDVRLVRMTPDGGSEVFALATGPHDDVRPRLSGSDGGPLAVFWERRRRGGFDLYGVPLARDGSPARQARIVARFGPDVIDAATMPLPSGKVLLATARRDGAEVLIEAQVGTKPPLLVGTARRGSPLALRIRISEQGWPEIHWELDAETTATVEGSARGAWRAPRYRRRLPAEPAPHSRALAPGR